jgi:hypothetical protein
VPQTQPLVDFLLWVLRDMEVEPTHTRCKTPQNATISVEMPSGDDFQGEKADVMGVANIVPCTSGSAGLSSHPVSAAA